MIILEGPDSVGKTTLARHLENELNLPMLPRRVRSDSIACMPWESYQTLVELAPRGTVADRWEAISSPIYRQYGGSRTQWPWVSWSRQFLVNGLRSGEVCLIFLTCTPSVLRERLHSEWQPTWVLDNYDNIVMDYVRVSGHYFRFPNVYWLSTKNEEAAKIGVERIANAYAG